MILNDYSENRPIVDRCLQKMQMDGAEDKLNILGLNN